MALAVAAGLTPPEQRGRALAVAFGGMMLATVLGIPLSAWLGGLVGWRAVLLVIGSDRSGGGGGRVPAGARHQRGWPGQSRHAVRRCWSRRRPGLSVATTLLQMAAQFATYALLLPYLTDRAGVAASWGAVAFFMFGIGGIVGNLAAGRLADRIGADRTVAFSLGGVALTFLGLMRGAAGRSSLRLRLLAVWAVTGVMFQAPQQKRLVTIDPAARGLLLSLNSSALYLGMSLGAFLVRRGPAPLRRWRACRSARCCSSCWPRGASPDRGMLRTAAGGKPESRIGGRVSKGRPTMRRVTLR